MLATGESHSVREFCERAFAEVGFCLVWRGGTADEVGIDAISDTVLIAHGEAYMRPTEISELRGDTAKARAVLGWRHRVGFPELVREMVAAEWLAATGQALDG